MRPNFCTVCGQHHDTTGCPTTTDSNTVTDDTALRRQLVFFQQQCAAADEDVKRLTAEIGRARYDAFLAGWDFYNASRSRMDLPRDRISAYRHWAKDSAGEGRAMMDDIDRDICRGWKKLIAVDSRDSNPDWRLRKERFNDPGYTLVMEHVLGHRVTVTIQYGDHGVEP